MWDNEIGRGGGGFPGASGEIALLPRKSHKNSMHRMKLTPLRSEWRGGGDPVFAGLLTQQPTSELLVA